MALRQFYNEIRGMKVKDVPAVVKPMMSRQYISSSLSKAFDSYYAKYIQTSSVEPLNHIVYGGILFSYLVALPEERRHLEHQKHSKEHAH